MNISSAAPLEARFQLNAADYQAFQILASGSKPLITTQKLIRVLLAVFVLIFVASFMFYRMLASGPATSPANTVIGPKLDTIFLLFIPFGAFMMFSGWLLRLHNRNLQTKNVMFTEPTLITLDETALTRQCGAFSSRAQWHGVARVIVCETHLSRP